MNDLIPLHDGRPGLRTRLPIEIHEPSPWSPINSINSVNPINPSTAVRENSSNSSEPSSDNPCLDFISSDETLDRYSEIISAAGWKLDSYQRNPVFQNAHQYGDVIFTLGRALATEVRGGKLYQRIQFATDVNPMARIAHGLYRGKFLNAVSVGFIPLRWQNADGTEQSIRSAPDVTMQRCNDATRRPINSIDLITQINSGQTAHSELRTQQPRRRYLEQELLEVSAVAIPANPNALALGLKSGALEKSDLRDLADLLRLTLDHPVAVSLSPGERAGVRGNSAPKLDHTQRSTINTQLLETARQLRDVLKHL